MIHRHTEKETEPGSGPGPECELLKPQSPTQVPYFLQQGHTSMSLWESFLTDLHRKQAGVRVRLAQSQAPALADGCLQSGQTHELENQDPGNFQPEGLCPERLSPMTRHNCTQELFDKWHCPSDPMGTLVDTVVHSGSHLLPQEGFSSTTTNHR